MDRPVTTAGILRNSAIPATLALLVMLTGACRNPTQTDIFGSLATFQRFPDPDPVEFTYQPDNPILPIVFGSFSEKTVIIDNAAGKQAFLVKTNSSTRVIPASETGFVQSRNLTVAPDQALGSYPGRREHEAALLFNANPPPITQEAQARSSQTNAILYGAAPAEFIEGTTRKYFWVEAKDENGNSVFVEKPATLQAIGKYSYVWIADENYNPASSDDRDNILTAAQARLIRDKFDGTSTVEAGNRDGIFMNVSTIFGYEYGGGDESVNIGGRDGDQHISILLYDIDFDHSREQTGGVFGYFWSKDFYLQEQLNSNLKTNYAEIFYLDVHFADAYPEDIYSTMAHEYQHMIHFNMKNVRLGKNSATWFNELCSMVAEDLVLGNIGLDPVRNGPQSRLAVFAYHYAESGVSDWLDDDEVLKSYAGAFAFGAYLARNFGGAAFFHELLHNDKVNEAAISAAMATLSVDGSPDNGLGFDQELMRYGEALVLTEVPASERLRSLNRQVTSTLAVFPTTDPASNTEADTISYTALPINLGTLQQYNLNTEKTISNTYGLRTYHPLYSTSLQPYGNSIHTRDSWANIPGEMTIILEAPGDSAVKYYLIVR